MNNSIVIRPRYRVVDYLLVVLLITFIWSAAFSYSQIVIALLIFIGLIGYIKLLWDEVYEVIVDEEFIIFHQNFIMKRRQVIAKSIVKKIIFSKSDIPGPNELNVELEGNKTTFTFFGDDKIITSIENLFLNNDIEVEKSSKLRFPRGF